MTKYKNGYIFIEEIIFSALAILFLIGLVFAGLFVRWNPSDKTLTGYVYQRQEAFGKAKYSIRFSQNAGEDEQPSFCAKLNSEKDGKLKKVVGSDQKVTIKVPKYFKIAPFWHCVGEGELVEAK